jgi:hypothetical protein
MSDTRGRVLCIVLLLVALVGIWQVQQPAAAQGKADGQAAGRFKMLDLHVGKFVYRFLFDTASADQWVWVNGEWERPEPPKDGVPWKGIKPTPGRFQLLSQVPGEIDASLYVLDTATGRTWVRSARNRTQLLAPESWQEVAVPGLTKR